MEVKMIKLLGLKVDFFVDLFKVKELCGEMGDVDVEGVFCGSCKICDKACMFFVKFFLWKCVLLLNYDVNNEEYMVLYNVVVFVCDGIWCVCCGCESSNYCNEKEFCKRECFECIEKICKEDEVCVWCYCVWLLGECV